MGYDRWYLHVDADERLVFDGAPADGRPGRGLAELVAFAEARGLRRLRGMLVDLYPPGPLLAPEARDHARAGARACCSTPTATPRRSASSGSRARAGRGGAPSASTPSSPSTRCSTSAPARWSSSPHHLHPYPENYRSDCFLGLLHDKFGPGFRAKAERAAAEGNYWRRSLEYRATLAALARDPGLALAYPGSRRYRAPADLVAAGLIAPIPWAGRPRLLARLAGWGRRRAVALRLIETGAAGEIEQVKPRRSICLASAFARVMGSVLRKWSGPGSA